MSTQAIRPPDTLRADHNASSIFTSGLAYALPLRRRPLRLPGPGHHPPWPDRNVRTLRSAALHRGQVAPAPLPDPHALLQATAAKDACQQATAALRGAVTCARQAGHP